ncbi:MAG TPA: hypothetical protein VFQ82_04485 [Stellaceae bacterium]|jgi:hypothetical protein|nr:hypothetical protein [Stellaceae bacterium]
MKKRALAAAAAALGAAVAASAHAGVSLQGPRLTGIALQSLEASRPVVVTGTILPSAETVGVHRPTTN